MKKILIIGNNNKGQPVYDGGRIKTRLYFKKACDEGYDASILEIKQWYLHFFKIVSTIKKAIKNHDRIVIMAGPKGCRFFIPLVCKYNKNGGSDIVFCPLGVGTLDKLIKKLPKEDVPNFMKGINFYGRHDDKMGNYLKKMKYIIVQSQHIKSCYEKFYCLKNAVVLNNFRENISIFPNKKEFNKDLHLCFASRVNEEKGILELMQVCKNINDDKSNTNKIYLDIFGSQQISDVNLFNSLLSEYVNYKGVVSQSEITNKIAEYDLFVLPTKYHGEGIPGSVIEAMISGTPSLVSSFGQADELIENEINGFIFKINDINSLQETLIKINKNRELLKNTSMKAFETGQKYSYQANKDDFLKYFCGK